MKVLKLIKAEIFKLLSKKSTYILTIALILIMAGISIVVKLTNTQTYDYSNYEYEWKLQDMEHYADIYKEGTEDYAKIATAIANNQIELIKDLIKASEGVPDFVYSSWQGKVYLKYYEAKSQIFIAELLNKGYKAADIQQVLQDMYVELNYYEIMQLESKVDVTKYIKEKTDIADKSYKIYKDNDHIAYMQGEIKELKEIIKNNDESIKYYKTELKKTNLDKEYIETLNRDIKSVEKEQEKNNEILKVYNYYVDEKIDAIATNWKYNTLQNILEVVDRLSYLESYIMTEQEYYANSKSQEQTYDEYMEEVQTMIQESQNEYDIYWYAVKNDIPVNVDNAKTTATSSMVPSIVGVVSIIIAGAIVAHEFSTGTIRFLLTRPVKRFKILLSKLVVVILVTFVFMLIAYATVITTSGILYSFNDYTIPELVIENGKVIEDDYLSNEFYLMLIYLVPTYLFVILAFAISTVIKSTAAAVGVSLGGWFAGFIANTFIVELIVFGDFISKVLWIKYTPIPYLDFSYFTKAEYALGLSTSGFTIGLGSLVLLAYILVFIVVSFIVFIKQDIKNQ